MARSPKDSDEPLRPYEAFWNSDAGMGLLMYNGLRKTEKPEQVLLDFLESVYQAGAKRANWDMGGFRLPVFKRAFKKATRGISGPLK